MRQRLWTTFGFPQEIGLRNFLATERDSIASESMTNGESAFDGWTEMLMMSR
jgi:hypothetical protein